MDVVYNHVCSLDVHKKNIVACTITPEGKEIRTFEAMTDDLILLVDWIKAKGCTHVRHGEHRRLLEANLQSVGTRGN